MSMLASLSILVTLILVVGWLVALGWDLGVLESMCMAICVGICVDFTCHFAHSYNHAKPSNRQGRTTHSLVEMGISVIAAAATTFTAACVLMFATTVTFFVSRCLRQRHSTILVPFSPLRMAVYLFVRASVSQTKFGAFLAICMVCSVVIALLFFHALLAIVGPSDADNEMPAIDKAYLLCGRRRATIAVDELALGSNTNGWESHATSNLRFSTETI